MNSSRYQSRSARSKGIRCAVRTRSHSSHRGLAPAAYDSRADVAGAREAVAQSSPTVRWESSTGRPWQQAPCNRNRPVWLPWPIFRLFPTAAYSGSDTSALTRIDPLVLSRNGPDLDHEHSGDPGGGQMKGTRSKSVPGGCGPPPHPLEFLRSSRGVRPAIADVGFGCRGGEAPDCGGAGGEAPREQA